MVLPESSLVLLQKTSRQRDRERSSQIEKDEDTEINFPMKKQGKLSKKKHLSKEAFRKIRYKQNMWRVYKHTGKDKDYTIQYNTIQ